MLTITTADPSNTQAKLKRIIEVPRCPGKSQIAKTIVNIPTDATPHQLNVRDAYIRHIEQQNADLKTQITDMQDHVTQADRVIFALLASLIVLAVIVITVLV